MKKLLFLSLCACFSLGMNAANYFVDGSVGSAGTGASWDSPFKTIAAAVSAATGNGSISVQDTIYIKEGTYAERIALTVTNTDKISLKGSYLSISTGSDLSQRSLSLHPTILDGSTLGAGSPGLSISKTSGSADMLIIQNFLATGTSQGTPGGLSIAISTAVVSNCIIRNNTHTSTAAKGSAGGVYMTGGTMRDCEIYGNVLSGTGSGVGLMGGGVQTIGGTITRCKIYNNTTNGVGGGIFVGKVNTSYATHDYIALSAAVNISNCAIYNNGKEGIAIGLLSTGTNTVTLTNNTIANNESKNYFKAAAATTPFTLSDINPSYLIATNNIFSNNGAIEDFTVLSSMTYNAINMASVSGTGNIALANTNTAAGFVSPSSVNGYNASIPASVTSANWRLLGGSAGLEAGTGGSGTDLAGNARVVGAVDMGAYELPAGAPAAPVATDASNLTGNTAIANWGAVAGATGYTVTVTDLTMGTAYGPFTVIGGATNSALLILGTLRQFNYTVVATNASGSSAASNVIAFELNTTTQVSTPVENRVYVSNGQLVVSGASAYSVYNTQGIEVARAIASSNRIALRPGIYVVKVGNKTQKIFIK